MVHIWSPPSLTEERRPKIFGSRGRTVRASTLLSDGDFLLLAWKLVWKLEDSRENVLYVRGLPWKLVGNFGSRKYLKSDLVCPWYMAQNHIQLWNPNQGTTVVCRDMGWLWIVGSIKFYVSFAKEPYKSDIILQKRPIISSILLTVATP